MEHELLARLSERLDRLEAENERLRAALARESRATAGRVLDDGGDLPSPVSRRAWLARGAAVAVGAVAGTAVLAQPVAAVGEVFLNVDNAGSAETNIHASLGGDIFESVFGAVNNSGTQGTGLFGYGPSYGTLGFSAYGTGVWGKASGDVGNPAVGTGGYIDNPDSGGSIGVAGEAPGVGQIGVKGLSTAGWGAWFESGFAEMTLGGSSRTAPTADLVQHYYGDVVAQNGGNLSTLWYCVQSGTPGTWRRLVAPGSAGALTILPTAVRVYDSRPGQPPLLGDKSLLATGVDRVVNCTLNASGVPTDAVGVLLNVTAVNQSGAGNLSVRASAAPFVGTSNLNWIAAGQTVANSATSGCSAGASIAVRLSGAVSSNVIVDVVGYYR
ncbi:MAG: hypothetical protein Q7V88_15545 [Actinomycetota bacterium]|nr:hypothetical protein [Actinomycetota bacterium]